MESILRDAIRLVETAKEKGITIRLMGATAIKVHCPNSLLFYEKLGREISDIDLMAYARQKKVLVRLLESLNFSLEKYIALVQDRYIFHHSRKGYKVDVFFDQLKMCHTIDFRKRLEIDYPTISLADLLLEKMQIVKLDEKDIKDSIILLSEHKIADNDEDKINHNYIARILSRDWGFYYTVTTNLKRIRDEFLPIYLPKEEESIRGKISILLNRIEREPKTLSWKIRSRIGTKKQWYENVEDVILS